MVASSLSLQSLRDLTWKSALDTLRFSKPMFESQKLPDKANLHNIGVAWILIFSFVSIVVHQLNWESHFLHRAVTSVLFGVLLIFSARMQEWKTIFRWALVLWAITAGYRSYYLLNSGDYTSFSQAHLTWTGVSVMTPFFNRNPRSAVGSCISMGLITLLLPHFCDNFAAARSAAHQVLFNMVFLFAVSVGALVSQSRKKLRLLRAKEIAESLTAKKTEFVSIMSHEFMTPLNSMCAHTQFLIDSGLTDEQREHALRSQISATALLTLAKQILDFAKIESADLVAEDRPFDVRMVVQSVMKICGGIARRTVALSASVAPEVPSILLADNLRLQQVLINLVGNACKFTKEGDVIVRVYPSPIGTSSVQNQKPDAVSLTFEVQDTGIGISSASAARLFQPFSQVDRSSTREFGGAGLGLVIAKRLTRLLGGDITLESEEGRGSIFRATVMVRRFADCTPCDEEYNFREDGLGMTTPERRASICTVLPIPAHLDQLSSRLDRFTDYMRQESVSPTPPAFFDTPIRPIRSYSAPDPFPRPETPQMFEVASGSTTLCCMNRLTPSPCENAKGARVLVVEDCIANMRVICSMLRRLDCEVDKAWNGEEAVQKVIHEKKHYDIILMDIQMPKMDGNQATRLIRRNESQRRNSAPARSMPIIAVTANENDCAHDAGLDKVITKPVQLATLRAILEDHVRMGEEEVHHDRCSTPDIMI